MRDDGWIGRAVVPTAGRDRGVICVVLREDGEYLYLADGRIRPVERPKKKKRKHVRSLCGSDGNLLRFDGEVVTNRFVRQWIRQASGQAPDGEEPEA